MGSFNVEREYKSSSKTLLKAHFQKLVANCNGDDESPVDEIVSLLGSVSSNEKALPNSLSL